MKKFNKNIIVFVLCSVIIIAGFTGGIIKSVGSSVKQAVKAVFTLNIDSLAYQKSRVESAVTDDLRYHDLLMDVNSVKDNLLNKRVIEKDGSTIIKSDSGSLFGPFPKRSSEEIEGISERINGVKTAAEENGAKFVYCGAPSKNYYYEAPANIEHSEKANYNALMSKLSEKSVPNINLADFLKERGRTADEDYFYTDHHWKPEVGFAATEYLCKKLNSAYGFSYNEQYFDINNYNVKTYKKWFLGSYGKKVGTYFSWHGADDFDLITPKFDTDFTVSEPFKDTSLDGSFEKTIIVDECVNKKDYYGINTYASYCGGDHRLQVFKNKLNQNGVKVLMVRDSFACVVAPFLALQVEELHTVDIRNMEGQLSERVNVSEYIREVNPDYVIILYGGTRPLDGENKAYDFN